MLAAFDIGNTSTLMGLYHSPSAAPWKLFRFPTVKGATGAMLHEAIINFLREYISDSSPLTGMALSSVVPEIVPSYSELASENFGLELVRVSHQSPLSFVIDYETPHTLGPDRITNSEAAVREHGGGIIVDIGTAVTICVVTSDLVYRGGLIAPGPATGMKALAGAASMLPEVNIERPLSVTAKNTVHAIQSGIWYGWCAMLNGLTEMISREHNEKLKIIYTGGFAEHMSADLRFDVIDPLLTMKGLGYIYGNWLKKNTLLTDGPGAIKNTDE